MLSKCLLFILFLFFKNTCIVTNKDNLFTNGFLNPRSVTYTIGIPSISLINSNFQDKIELNLANIMSWWQRKKRYRINEHDLGRAFTIQPLCFSNLISYYFYLIFFILCENLFIPTIKHVFPHFQVFMLLFLLIIWDPIPFHVINQYKFFKTSSYSIFPQCPGTSRCLFLILSNTMYPILKPST